MADLSLRGLDSPTLSRLRASARRRGVSVNRLIVEILRREFSAGATRFHDLDALAGTWSKAEGDAFDAAVKPFSEVDPALWAAQPRARYRVKPARPRKAPK